MKKFGKGAVKSPYDIRDFKFAGAGVFDWNTGFDIEEQIKTKLITKDQNGSFSCGGQAWAYYGEVLETLADGDYEPRSAKWIYSHTAVPGGGSNGRTNSDFVINKGWAREDLVPSYNNGKAPTEAFITKPVEVTNDIIEDTEINKALSYLQVSGGIDTIANAIAQNNGVIIGVDGEDNSTWLSPFPQPPKTIQWRHWLYAGKAKLINGKKFIGVKNSWGDIGDNGWQWIGEEYFNTGHIFESWTLAWDYKPAKHKQLLIQLIALYKQLIESLKK